MAEATQTEASTATETTATPATTTPAGGPSATLIAKPETTATAESTPKAEASTDAYLGSWKTKEEAEKGVKELQTKLRSPVAATPDSYDFAPVKDAGLTFNDDKQEKEIAAALKDAGVTQDGLGKLAPMAKQFVEAGFKMATAHFGEPLDEAKEGAALKAKWGNDFETRMKVVTDAVSTLPPEVFRTPLDRSAAGVDLLYQFIAATRGPDFIRDSAPTGDINTVQNRVKELARGTEMYDPKNPKRDELRDEFRRLNTILAGAKQ